MTDPDSTEDMLARGLALHRAGELQQAVNCYRRAIEAGTRSADGRPGPTYWQQRVDYSIGVSLEPETARQDLKEMLSRLDPSRATCGIWLNCCARGTGFFGVPGLEAAYLEQALGSTPVAGMLGSCEIGPVAGRTELLTYTGVLALV